ncbi:hypothetical protein TUM19329_08320 [Legionella antarctica]|uniref:Uncharacterized protein n=1 Tax=Legionella antarctica TaxID=2708020 RepID=A0A6F8T1Y0_9GAMM|nr:hypothetical protein [Legionella antarctica]BCA94471.1 hypothetical protein TUM19329_08320 [Legionella antarctica]
MKMKKRAFSSTIIALILCSQVTEVRAGGYVDEPELWNGAYWGLSFGAGGGSSKGEVAVLNSSANEQTNNLGVILTSTQNITPNIGVLNADSQMSQAQLFIGYNVHQPNSRLVYGGQIDMGPHVWNKIKEK